LLYSGFGELGNDRRGPGVGGILLRQGYWLSLLFLDGIAWTVVAYRRFDSRPVRFPLVGAAGPVVLLVVSIFGDAGPPPLCSVSFVEPALVPLLAIVFGGWLVRESLPTLSVFGRPSPIPVPYPRFTFASLAFLLLFITRIFSPVAIPDFPNDYHSYMSEPEMDSKSFGYERVDGPVYSG